MTNSRSHCAYTVVIMPLYFCPHGGGELQCAPRKEENQSGGPRRSRKEKDRKVRRAEESHLAAGVGRAEEGGAHLRAGSQGSEGRERTTGQGARREKDAPLRPHPAWQARSRHVESRLRIRLPRARSLRPPAGRAGFLGITCADARVPAQIADPATAEREGR